jgi:hypothetical protein
MGRQSSPVPIARASRTQAYLSTEANQLVQTPACTAVQPGRGDVDIVGAVRLTVRLKRRAADQHIPHAAVLKRA